MEFDRLFKGVFTWSRFGDVGPKNLKNITEQLSQGDFNIKRATGNIYDYIFGENVEDDELHRLFKFGACTSISSGDIGPRNLKNG